jgi:hypothetical protein
MSSILGTVVNKYSVLQACRQKCPSLPPVISTHRLATIIVILFSKNKIKKVIVIPFGEKGEYCEMTPISTVPNPITQP